MEHFGRDVVPVAPVASDEAGVGRLGYEVIRQTGSHKTLEAPGRPTLHLAFHDDAELAPGLVRKILCRDVGLSESDAQDLL